MSTSTQPVHPVRVDAHLDDHLSRWLWLVKWFLAIPHFVVLALLWIAFVVLSVVALVAILFTGRYPRSIFDFNVGVLRWSWRVSYYAYGGLGTDHYPPFSLEERPDYPAHLEVAYPEHLSRGLVLVKWWLLAIPHYLVLALFMGGGAYAASDDVSSGWNGGLIGLLVLFAGVLLLFTGRYPRPLFDLVLGLNRWVLRVAAYVALMTDVYPPFRLDMGGDEPGLAVLSSAGPATPTVTRAATPSPTAPTAGPAAGPAVGPTADPTDGPTVDQTPTGADRLPPPSAPVGQVPPGGPVAPGGRVPPAERWGAGRILAVVIGSLAAMLALALLTGGIALRIADNVWRDDDGYLMSSTETYVSPGLAVTSDSVELRDGSPDVSLASELLGTVRIEATSPASAGAFVGIAPTSEVDAWLAGTAHSTVVDPSNGDAGPDTTYVDGSSDPLRPADESFWAASASGQGRQVLGWEPQDGDWTVVVMNADGSAPVRARVAVGAEVPVLDDIADGLIITGALLLPLSALVLWLAVRRRTPAGQPGV
jgi:hypothetical protein